MEEVMKTFNGMFSIILAVLFIVSAGAQDHSAHQPSQEKAVQSDNNPGSERSTSGTFGKKEWCVTDKHPGMMKMMDSNRMMILHPIFHTIYHLSDMKEELKLSNKQVDQLSKISHEFHKKDATWNALIEKNQFDLDLKVRDNASIDDVKKYFQAISVTKIEQQTSAYETAQKMFSILDENQKEIWQGISSVKSCCTGQEHVHMSHIIKRD
jgi:hypothetical protein